MKSLPGTHRVQEFLLTQGDIAVACCSFLNRPLHGLPSFSSYQCLKELGREHFRSRFLHTCLCRTGRVPKWQTMKKPIRFSVDGFGTRTILHHAVLRTTTVEVVELWTVFHEHYSFLSIIPRIQVTMYRIQSFIEVVELWIVFHEHYSLLGQSVNVTF